MIKLTKNIISKLSNYSGVAIAGLLAFLIIVTTFYPGFSKTSHQTNWLQRAKWGVFVHHIAESNSISAREWNNRVNNFDVEGVAQQLQRIGAKYYVITIGQNSGHYCSPNHTYDKYVGIKPSKCSSRDLIADLYKALNPRGIKLMVYLPSGAPSQDKIAVSKLEWTNGPYRNESFQKKWENVIREWSLRWGNKVQGWWFDGVYWPDVMYNSPKPPNFKTFSESAKAGNPNSLLAFNPGPTYPIINPTEYGDFTAGEVNDPRGVECDGKLSKETQFHVLGFLGSNWGTGNKQYSDDEVIRTTQNIIQCGGTITWDVPVLENGHIPKEFVEQLTKLRHYQDKPLIVQKPNAIPSKNLASHKKTKLLNLEGTKILPVNSAKRFPQWGVDGNPKTFALASDNWAWTYQIDLSKIFLIKKIVITFGPGYATEYKVRASTDNIKWTTVVHNQKSTGGKYYHNFIPIKTRYVQINGIKPDRPNQVGTQMSIAEVEVYE